MEVFVPYPMWFLKMLTDHGAHGAVRLSVWSDYPWTFSCDGDPS